MPGTIHTGNATTYLKIIDGRFSRKVPEGTEGAKFRKWEVGKDKGDLWEILYDDWIGIVDGIVIRNSKYGKGQKECLISIGDAMITVNTKSKYFRDFACKIFSADRSKPIFFRPFSFEVPERERPIVGLTLKQDMEHFEIIEGYKIFGRKMKNHFKDEETKKPLHGYPQVDEERKDEDGYWTVYYIAVANFLVEQLGNLKRDSMNKPKVPPISPEHKPVTVEKVKEIMTEEVSVDNLPF